jgi:hypothetical protein
MCLFESQRQAAVSNQAEDLPTIKEDINGVIWYGRV